MCPTCLGLEPDVITQNEQLWGALTHTNYSPQQRQPRIFFWKASLLTLRASWQLVGYCSRKMLRTKSRKCRFRQKGTGKAQRQ